MAPRVSEHALQVAVAQYLSVALRPPTIWTSIDAGAGKLSRATAGLRKARGVKRGWPDIIVMHPNHDDHTRVVGIELKAAKGTMSKSQSQMFDHFLLAKAVYIICRSVDQVEALLGAFGIPLHATVLPARAA